ncbi:hypothetical protein ACFX1X_041157 [Malus domestica]
MNGYYRRFIDLSRYHSDVAANPVEMLRHFKLSNKKMWCSLATTTHCTSYQEFYEILLKTKRICSAIVMKKRKRMGIRGKMIKVKVSHLKDFVKLRASKEVELTLVLLAEVLVLLV